MTVSLILLPGNGLTPAVALRDGATVADLVAARGLQGRSIVVNGVEVAPARVAYHVLSQGDEVAALQAVKGAQSKLR